MEQDIKIKNSSISSELKKYVFDEESLTGFGSDVIPHSNKIISSKFGGNVEKAFEYLENDDFVAGVMDRVKKGVNSLEYTINKNEASDDEFELAKRLTKEIFTSSFKYDVMKSNWYGYQPLQIYWREEEKFKVPVAIEAAPLNYFGYKLDAGVMIPNIVDAEGKIIAEAKFYDMIIPRNEPNFKNPYGNSILLKCYWALFFKKHAAQFYSYFVEKFGTPLVTAAYKSSQDESEDQDIVDEFIEAVESLYQDGAFILPEGTYSDLKIESAGSTQNSDIYKGFIDFWEQHISINILGHSAAVTSTPGKLGNEMTSIDASEDTIYSHAEKVVWTINEIFRIVHEVNGFSSETYPTIELFEKDSLEVQKNRAERDKILSEIGVQFNKEYIQNYYGIDDSYFEIQAPSQAPQTNLSEAGESFEAADKKFEKETIKNRDSIEAFADSFTRADDAGETQDNLMSSAIEPLIKAIEKAESFEEAMKILKPTFKDMKTNDLEDFITNINFTCRVHGSESIKDEESDNE